jgi:hypothetical protein
MFQVILPLLPDHRHSSISAEGVQNLRVLNTLAPQGVVGSLNRMRRPCQPTGPTLLHQWNYHPFALSTSLAATRKGRAKHFPSIPVKRSIRRLKISFLITQKSDSRFYTRTHIARNDCKSQWRSSHTSTPNSLTNNQNNLTDTMLSGIMQQKKSAFAAIAFVTLFIVYFLRLQFGGTEASAVHLGADQDTTFTTPQDHSEPNTIVKNVAVIIEDRSVENLVPLLLHFSSVLGPDWPIILYTSRDVVPDSAPLHRAIEKRRIAIRMLPSDVHFNNQQSVSGFLTLPWLWEQLDPAGHVLIFQADSILCSRSPLRVDDFLEYDFVGAPVDPTYGQGYNGGLSLRNRSMVLDIVRRFSWLGELNQAENKQEPSVKFEDQWFYKKMKELGASLPSVEVAKTFSVETIWYDTPLGFHQIERWQSERIDLVDQWCPEHRMATTDLLISHHGR